jgi:hypothetical protein
VKHSEAIRAIRTFAALVRAAWRQEELTEKELHTMLSQAMGEETLSQKRARAGGAGGKRSAEVRGEKLGTAQPRSKTRSTLEAGPEPNAEANPKQNELASTVPVAPVGPPLHSPSGSGTEKPKESAVVAKDQNL